MIFAFYATACLKKKKKNKCAHNPESRCIPLVPRTRSQQEINKNDLFIIFSPQEHNSKAELYLAHMRNMSPNRKYVHVVEQEMLQKNRKIMQLSELNQLTEQQQQARRQSYLHYILLTFYSL